jgi:hypothetical protein
MDGVVRAVWVVRPDGVMRADGVLRGRAARVRRQWRFRCGGAAALARLARLAGLAGLAGQFAALLSGLLAGLRVGVRAGLGAGVGIGWRVGRPAVRVGGEAEQVRDCAVQGVGQVGQAAHGQAAAVLYRAERLVGQVRPVA